MKARGRAGAGGGPGAPRATGDTRLHQLLAERIIESIEIADQLSVSDPCPLTAEAKGLLRRAYASVSDRAAAIRLLERQPRQPAAKPSTSEILRRIQAKRARQPRRSPLARFLGARP